MWSDARNRFARPVIGRLEAALGIAVFLAVSAWSMAPRVDAMRQIAPGVCQFNATGPSGTPVTMTFPCTDGQSQIDIKACPVVPDTLTIATAAARLVPAPDVTAIAAAAAALVKVPDVASVAAAAAALVPTPPATPPLNLRGLAALLALTPPFTWKDQATALYQLRAPDASSAIVIFSGSLTSDTLGFVTLQACADASCTTGIREQSTPVPVWPHTQVAIPFGTAAAGSGLYLKFWTIVNGVATPVPMTTTGRALILP